MTKKQVKVLLIIIQILLLALLFMPCARTEGINPALLSVFDLVRRYADLGHGADSLAYIVLAVCCPVISALSPLLLHERKNFGMPACVGALTCVVHACFSEAVKNVMSGSVMMTGLYAILIFLAFTGTLAAIHGFLVTAPPAAKDGGDEL